MQVPWRRILFVLLLLAGFIYLYSKITTPPKVVINQSVAVEKVLQPNSSGKATPEITYTDLAKKRREKPEVISLDKLEKPVNKSFNLIALDMYFKTPNIQEKKQEFSQSINNYRQKYSSPPDVAQYQNSPETRFVQQGENSAATQEIRKEYAVFLNVSNTVSGSRVINEAEMQKSSWEAKAQRPGTYTTSAKRVVLVELPRKFEDFSLGDNYKSKTDVIVINRDSSWQETSILDSVEGRLFEGKMYYFVINFRKNVDPYYLAAVLQNIFGTEALLRKIGSYLVFNWADAKTKIEYTIYSDNSCRLHFYDTYLGKRKLSTY